MSSNQPSRAQEPGRAGLLVALARAYPARTFVLLLAVAVGVYLAATHLLPSEKREVRNALGEVRDGLVEGDADKVLARVSPYFSEEGVDKQWLAGWLRRSLPRHPVDRASLVFRRIDVHNSIAEVILSVRSFHHGRYARSEWSMVLEKIEGRWLVRRATPIELDGHPAAGFRSVLWRR